MKRNISEFGNLGLLEDREEDDEKLRLPGARKTDMASRSFKPEVRVAALKFSPTGRAWCAATNEGLLVYSLDSHLIFDPFRLDESITPKTIRDTLDDLDYSKGI